MDGSHATASDERTTHARLQELIETRRAVIEVIGLGYVGLPLVCAFAGSGFRSLGFDIDRSKVDRLIAGESYSDTSTRGAAVVDSGEAVRANVSRGREKIRKA
jgi:UDP-N-acetyl-D-glucosamine dehydrogenase